MLSFVMFVCHVPVFIDLQQLYSVLLQLKINLNKRNEKSKTCKDMFESCTDGD